jgi:hypothetical protein
MHACFTYRINLVFPPMFIRLYMVKKRPGAACGYSYSPMSGLSSTTFTNGVPWWVLM